MYGNDVTDFRRGGYDLRVREKRQKSENDVQSQSHPSTRSSLLPDSRLPETLVRLSSVPPVLLPVCVSTSPLRLSSGPPALLPVCVSTSPLTPSSPLRVGPLPFTSTHVGVVAEGLSMGGREFRLVGTRGC